MYKIEIICKQAGIPVSSAIDAIMASLDIHTRYPTEEEAYTLLTFVELGHLDRCTQGQHDVMIALAKGLKGMKS